METLLIVMMALVCLTFVLKQTFHHWAEVLVAAVALALFTGLMWSLAIEQSATQIAAWLANQQLMLNVAVLLSLDVSLTLLFCVTWVDVRTAESVSPRRRLVFRLLKHFPGLLIFPVLFSLLVKLVFTLTGIDFRLISWGFALVVLVLLPLFTWGVKVLLPERSIRLEMLFLLNVLLGLLGIVATVNGRTAVNGISAVNLPALLAVVALVALGMGLGGIIYRFRMNKQSQAINNKAKR